MQTTKQGVTLLSHQLVIARAEPLRSYLPTLTVLAHIVHGFYNHLLTENQGLVIADENFIRDGEAFKLVYQAEEEELRAFDQDFTQVVYAQFAALSNDQEESVVLGD